MYVNYESSSNRVLLTRAHVLKGRTRPTLCIIPFANKDKTWTPTNVQFTVIFKTLKYNTHPNKIQQFIYISRLIITHFTSISVQYRLAGTIGNDGEINSQAINGLYHQYGRIVKMYSNIVYILVNIFIRVASRERKNIVLKYTQCESIKW